MNNDIIINLIDVTKTYRLYQKPADRVKETFHPLRRKYHQPFHALNHVSLDIRRGEFIGIIGRNGSGKSTLLQLICGILEPSSGEVQVDGRISALLELGSGFNPEFTGRQNVYLNASILGFSKEEIDAKFDDIVAFADIGEFLDQPVKTYSSGMAVRLAFAVQANVDPDILIIDEALSVGDAYFQAKCMRRMSDLIERGVTILFVTHSVDIVPQLCNRAYYLENGSIKSQGKAIDVVDTYLRDVRAQQCAIGLIEDNESQAASQKRALLDVVPDDEGESSASRVEQSAPIPKPRFKADPAFDARVEAYRYGSGGARVRHLELLDVDGHPSDSFGFREIVTVRAHIETYKDADALNCCMIIRNKNGVEIMHCTSREYGYRIPAIGKGQRVIVDIAFENILKPMDAYSIHYTVNNTYTLQEQEIMDLIELAAVFNVRRDPRHPCWYLIWHPFQFSHKTLPRGDSLA